VPNPARHNMDSTTLKTLNPCLRAVYKGLGARQTSNRGSTKESVRYGLSEGAWELLILLRDFALRNNLPAPEVISGYRSVERQEELQKQWDQGNRIGLKVRPANDSAHTRGNAFDLGNDKMTLYYFGQETAALGGRWGGNFLRRDPNHFDIERY
jgi:hypothetical protein